MKLRFKEFLLEREEQTKPILALSNWYFSDDAKRPILLSSEQGEIRVRGIVSGGEHDGKQITTSPIKTYKKGYSSGSTNGTLVQTDSGSNYLLAPDNIHPKYKNALDGDVIEGILSRIA